MRVLQISSLHVLRGVNFILTRTDGKVLVQKRSLDAPTYPGRFCIPGGAIDPEETPRQAVLRELWEETGVILPSLTPLCDIAYLRGDAKAMNRVFTTWIPRNVQVLSLEGEMHWKTIEEIEKLNLVLGENVLLSLLKEVIMTVSL